FTVGFEELAERAMHFSPARASAITGVAQHDVERLAREYATTQPAAIRGGVALERSAGGGDAVRAILSLPALVGSWRQPGGGEFLTPSGKCELKSALAAHGNLVLPHFRQGHTKDQPGTPLAAVPDYIVPCESPLSADGATRYPLSLLTPKSHAFL